MAWIDPNLSQPGLHRISGARRWRDPGWRFSAKVMSFIFTGGDNHHDR